MFTGFAITWSWCNFLAEVFRSSELISGGKKHKIKEGGKSIALNKKESSAPNVRKESDDAADANSIFCFREPTLEECGVKEGVFFNLKKLLQLLSSRAAKLTNLEIIIF